MNTDETLYFNAARAGDQEAFEQLIYPYRKQLLVHCYRILGSFEDAEDMLQETLIRVWKRLDSFEGVHPCMRGCTKSQQMHHWKHLIAAAYAASQKSYTHAETQPSPCRTLCTKSIGRNGI